MIAKLFILNAVTLARSFPDQRRLRANVTFASWNYTIWCTERNRVVHPQAHASDACRPNSRFSEELCYAKQAAHVRYERTTMPSEEIA